MFEKIDGGDNVIKGQTSVRDNIQDVLCPFTDWYCIQGSNDSHSHSGSEANDIRGIRVGVRYPYFAPVDVKCVNIDKKYAFVWWQSVHKVRLADGSIDYVTFLCGHDNSINCYVGQVVKQGIQIGNMGDAGNAEGVHCHIEVGIGRQSTWKVNKYNVYCIPDQIPLENVFFMDNTNIILGIANWKYLKDVVVESSIQKYINLNPDADTWRFYELGVQPISKNAKGTLKPSKFGGLSYTILGYEDTGNTAVIETSQFGKVKIYIKNKLATVTDKPIYNLIK